MGRNMMTAKFRKDILIVIGLSIAMIGIYGCGKKDESANTPAAGTTTGSPTDSTTTQAPSASADTPASESADATKPTPPKTKTPDEVAADVAKHLPTLTPEQQQQKIEKLQNSVKGTNVGLDKVGMPAYPGTKPVGAEKSEPGRKIYFFNMMTKDKYDKVLKFYKPTLKDMKEESDGSPFSIAGTSKNGTQLSVTARPWQDGSLTLIVITATKPN